MGMKAKTERVTTLAFSAKCSLINTTAPRILTLGLVLLTASSLGADDLQSWTDLELGLVKTERVEWSVGGVARIRDSLGSVYDRRATTGVGIKLNDSLGLELGYVLRNRTRSGFGFGWDHRPFVGLSYPILRRAVAVKGKTLYERHIGRPDTRDFNRYRQQFEIERPAARVSPWLYQSLAFKNEGFVRSRSRFGLRWAVGSGHSLKVAYQFESIKSGTARRPRHAVYTEWSFSLATSAKISQ